MNFSLLLVETTLSAKIYRTDFGRKYGGLFWEAFFQGFLVENCSTSGSIVAFGVIHENV